MRIHRVGPQLPLQRSKYFTRRSVLDIPLSAGETQERKEMKKIEPEFRVSEGTSGRSPAEVGACETVPADVRVRSSPSAADSRYSLLPHTEDVEGGNSKQPAAVQSQVAAFAPRGGVAMRMGVASRAFRNLSVTSKSQRMSGHAKSNPQIFKIELCDERCNPVNTNRCVVFISSRFWPYFDLANKRQGLIKQFRN